MSAPQTRLVTAIAFQLSAALESYQMDVDVLTDPWSQREQYERVSRQFDDVRMLKGALPDLSVAMVEVLICHVELMRGLWLSSGSPPPSTAEPLEALRRKHREAVSAMRAKCLRVFTRP